MRTVGFLLTICLLFPFTSGLRCLECSGVETEEQCRAQGRIRTCEFNEDACEIELRRHEGWGGALKMYKHCKQSKACDDNYVQNPRSAWVPSQCNPDDFNSVCRCCCYTDECNVAREDCFGTSGCGLLPSSLHQGTISCTDGRNSGSVCTVTCAPNTQMVGSASTQCRFDGLWSHPLPRCEDVYCPPKTLQYGWYVCTNGYRGGSTCTPNCWYGYLPSGPKSVTCRADGTWNNFLEPMCRPIQCPERGRVVGGVVNCTDENNRQSRCKITCDPGRRAVGVTDNYCQDNGEWSHPLPTCETIVCPPRGNVRNGDVACTFGSVIGSECRVDCDPGYAPDGPVDSSCLATGEWSEKLPRCIRVTCPPRGSLAGGNVFCDNGVFVGSICTATCMPGSQLVGADVSECLPNGEWNFPLPTCRRIECPERGEIDGGRVSCSNRRFVGSVCSARCPPNSILIGSVRSECLPSGEWDRPLPECPPITCPELSFTEGTMTCSNENFYKSVCRFQCPPGSARSGSPRLRCNRNGQWNTRVPRCIEIRCPPRGRLINGIVDCSDNNEVSSICGANCNEGFQLVGSASSICLPRGVWSSPLPVCIPIICPPRSFIAGGIITCTNGNFYQSECSVTCNTNTRLIGRAVSKCETNGRWDNPVPICESNPCEDQGDLEFGRIVCTDGVNMNSRCDFECTQQTFNLHPPDILNNTCQANQEWSRPKPCCARSCPPFAVMDIVVVLDSSSSIGDENWVSLTEFVESILTTFVVAPEAGNFAIFRYNRNVDVATQIFLNSYPGDIDGLINAFRRIPYDGRGTLTGAGLQHALEVSLAEENGNRPTVPDVVLVITDGRAGDDVKTPADNLRAAGATVLAVGIGTRLDRDQLLDITGGNSENILVAERGFEELSDDFTVAIAGTICRDPCLGRR